MVEIYTKKSAIPPRYKDYIFLDVNDAYFDRITVLEELTTEDKQTIENYEQAKILSGLKLETRDGIVADIVDISTGIKTVINIRYTGRHGIHAIVDITECGPDIVKEAVVSAEKYKIPLYLTHGLIPRLDDTEFIVNGIKAVDYLDLGRLLSLGENYD